MKATIRHRYGMPNILSVADLPMPQPKPNEVMIKVMASTVNRTDCGVLMGQPFIFRFFVGFPKPRLKSTGTDFAGVVEAVGDQVSNFKVGDRVWGLEDEGLGSHAQYFTYRADKNIIKIPDHIDFAIAAASAEGAHYAINFINKVKLTANQKVLVYGATGAIGSAAVQLLKNMGVYLTAVCGTAHVEQVKALGADKVIDYQTEDFTKDEEQYHFVFDAVGKSSFGICKKLLLPKGVYISSELGPRNENPFLAIITPFLGGKKVIFPIPVNLKGSLEQMNELLKEGKFKPLIDRHYPITRIQEAFHYTLSGQKIGNVILDLQSVE